MRRYQLKQKIFSLGDSYTICDEEGVERVTVRSKFFSMGKQLMLEDSSGRELVKIRQRILSFGPTFEISQEGLMMAIVKKQLFSLFKCRFSVDIPGPDDLEATGSFLEHEYSFTQGGK